MLRVLCVSLTFLVVSQGAHVARHGGERISGGTVAEDGAYPWMCSVRYLGDHECGCVILSDRFVLTAARCTNVLLISSLVIHVGSNHLNANGLEYQVDRVRRHPDYNENNLSTPDLAIVELKDAMQMSEKVVAATLPLQGELTPGGTDGIVLGWGQTTTVPPLSPDLLEAPQIAMENADCALLIPGQITDGQLCADSPSATVGVCSKDEGGPLMVGSVVQGILSYSVDRCSFSGSPAVYTRVAQYRDWIDGIVSPLS